MRNNFQKIIAIAVFAMVVPSGCMMSGSPVPNLTGEWHGVNHTVSERKGYQEWEKVVYITGQQDRRFRGYFEYAEGRRDFFGVIYPDNASFVWVSTVSKGYNFGRILGRDKISACYAEAGNEATAGCVELTRKTG